MQLLLSSGQASFLASNYDIMHEVMPTREAHMNLTAQSFYLGMPG